MTRVRPFPPFIVWLTGLSGSGKSAIAQLVDKGLRARGFRAYHLDGDRVRLGLCRDLGFTDADRVENIRRIAEVAALLVDAGLIVVVSAISPFRAGRAAARALMDPGGFFEVFVDAPLAEAEKRDAKGLYARARRGEIRHFTGIDSPYEPPDNPDVRIDTTVTSAGDAAEIIITALAQAGALDHPRNGIIASPER